MQTFWASKRRQQFGDFNQENLKKLGEKNLKIMGFRSRTGSGFMEEFVFLEIKIIYTDGKTGRRQGSCMLYRNDH